MLTIEKGTPLTETAKEADKVMEKLLKIEDIQDVGAMALHFPLWQFSPPPRNGDCPTSFP